MTKVALAFSTALLSMAFGTGAALALPTTIAGTSVPGLSPGVSDVFNVFVNNALAAQLQITDAGEAACTDKPLGLNGCSFSLDPVVVGSIVVSPNMSLSNQIAVFYEPDGVTISDIFAIGCDSSGRNALNGLCNGGGNFSIITPDPAHPFDLSVLPGAHVTIGFTGTELAGPATAFQMGNFLTATNTTAFGANFVSSNEVPEPLTLSLFGAGLVGAVAMRRRKRK